MTADKRLCVANIIEEGKVGGPQIRMIMAAAAMAEDVETIIVMPKENSELFQQLCEEAGVSYKVMPISRITKEWRVALRYLLFSFFEIFMIARYFKQGDFDLIHNSGGSWQYKGIVAGRIAGKKVLWHLNDTSLPGWLRKLFVLMSRFSDGLIFASKRSRKYYGSLLHHDKQEFVIPAPVDVIRYDPGRHYQGDEELIDRFGDEIVVGMVGNINPIKGVEVFIQAASLLSQRGDKLRFVVVGPVFSNQKQYFDSLRSLCEELGLGNFEFVGGRSDTRSLLKRFDIYVCSSHAESSPLSVWEAMSMEKAIVSTNVGDVPVYIQDGVNGFIVEVGDYMALADNLWRLVKDAGLRNTLGRRAREIAIESLDVVKCANLHRDAYRRILNPDVPATG